MSDCEYSRICRDRFDRIDAKLDRIDSWIRGNGGVGLASRIDRIERIEAGRRRAMWMVVGAAISSVAAAAAAWLRS